MQKLEVCQNNQKKGHRNKNKEAHNWEKTYLLRETVYHMIRYFWIIEYHTKRKDSLDVKQYASGNQIGSILRIFFIGNNTFIE